MKRVGEQVRARLAADPAIYKLPTDIAEIYALGDFLTAAECQRFIEMTDAIAKPSQLHLTAYIEKFRTSYSGDYDTRDPFVKGISRRIDDVLGLDPEWGESIQGQRYLPGQEFKAHNDWFYTDQDYWKVEEARGGQRCWTAMVFLNQVPKGGETHFTHAELSIEPKPGVLMIWNNATPEGEPNIDTMHAGTPVIEGAKYVLTKWYRTRPHR